MASTTTLRLRRSAAQLHALAKVERVIRASDPNSRRKYLREFGEAYPSYHSVLGPSQLQQALAAADILLVGDYHALAACQRYCARLLAERAAASKRPLVLAVEAIFARHQPIVDEWLAGDIDEQELRERLRYDLDWQYDWSPFYELLQSARAYGACIYGLDCTPRSDIRQIAARDRHAAQRLGSIRKQHPQAQIIGLFGESHLAPSHLPAELQRLLPGDRRLTVLQNLDSLYWQAAGERKHVGAVRMAEDAICVFTATPLEKYESYRLYLGQWQDARAQSADLAPVFYNLIEALLRVLGIDKFKAHGGHAPIVDLLPEVHSRRCEQDFQKLLARKGARPMEVENVLQELRVHGCCYVVRWNAILASSLNLRQGAALAAQFVERACRQRIAEAGGEMRLKPAADRFYASVLQHTLVYFGSRVLYPARPPVRQEDYYALYSQPRELVDSCSLYSYREYLEMLDFLLLHKDYETHRAEYLHPPQLIESAMHYSEARFEFVTRELGLMLGSELYDAYVSGATTRRSLRSLFFRELSGPGEASNVYFELARRVARPRRRGLGGSSQRGPEGPLYHPATLTL